MRWINKNRVGYMAVIEVYFEGKRLCHGNIFLVDKLLQVFYL
ncbi:hypothetical protein [Chryseobacterium sp. c4a]|nr:hypothetical protein [Chryseobacterium sp. c4a]